MSDTLKEKRILVVEDEAHLATALKLNLELEGADAVVATNGRDAIAALAAGPCDAIVLDIMLPDTDGFELCRRLRSAGNMTPVIMLTARTAHADRVRGLDAGADDYLGKPFELSELMARLRSLVRRRQWEHSGGETSQVFHLGEATIDLSQRSVTIRGTLLKFTHLEFCLLEYFLQNPQRVISREELLERVWELPGSSQTRTVDNFVSRLRRTLETDPAKPAYFQSVRGTGYRFNPPS